MLSIDKLDVQLLGLLSKDSRMSVAELANSLGVARNTVQSRMKRMESNGLLTGFRPNLNLPRGRYPDSGICRSGTRAGQDQRSRSESDRVARGDRNSRHDRSRGFARSRRHLDARGPAEVGRADRVTSRRHAFDHDHRSDQSPFRIEFSLSSSTSPMTPAGGVVRPPSPPSAGLGRVVASMLPSALVSWL